METGGGNAPIMGPGYRRTHGGDSPVFAGRFDSGRPHIQGLRRREGREISMKESVIERNKRLGVDKKIAEWRDKRHA